MLVPQRITIYIGVSVIVLILAGTWWRQHNADVAARAVAEAQVKQDKATIATLRKQLTAKEAQLLASLGRTGNALTIYDTVRLRVSSRPITDTVIVIQPGDTVEVVPAGYVRAADLVAQECTLLRNDCAAFRITSDSTVAAYERVVRTLEQSRQRGHGLLGDVVRMALASSVGYGVCRAGI